MKVEIWSDIACPWCYVGTARFEQALARFAHRDQVEVIHRSFELNPGHPLDQTEPPLEFFQTRHGVGPGQARAQEQLIQQLAEAEALLFSLERHAGNTRRAHELVHLGAAEGIDVIGPVFRTYFSAEGTIFTIDGLVDIARHAGIDPERARTALEDGTFTDAVRADEAAARPSASPASRSSSSTRRTRSPAARAPRPSSAGSSRPGRRPTPAARRPRRGHLHR